MVVSAVGDLRLAHDHSLDRWADVAHELGKEREPVRRDQLYTRQRSAETADQRRGGGVLCGAPRKTPSGCPRAILRTKAAVAGRFGLDDLGPCGSGYAPVPTTSSPTRLAAAAKLLAMPIP